VRRQARRGSALIAVAGSVPAEPARRRQHRHSARRRRPGDNFLFFHDFYANFLYIRFLLKLIKNFLSSFSCKVCKKVSIKFFCKAFLLQFFKIFYSF
jgi:hypothetical protein